MSTTTVKSTDQNGNLVIQAQSDFNVVDQTDPAYIKNRPEFKQVQSDWAQLDNTQPSYIKNKSSIPPALIPIASPSTLGGIRVGAGLNIDPITGILSAQSSSGTPTSMPKASDLGITNTGDQTTALNNAFANSNYAGIVMDFVGGGGITISSGVNCQGKVIYFQTGSYFTGTGTLQNPVLAAGLWQKIADVSVSMTGVKTTTGKFSALWYGYAIGAADTTYSIQKCIDTVISSQNTLRTLQFVSGSHYINQPLVCYSWNGTNYIQASIRLQGESPMEQRSGDGTVILANGYSNSFVIGFQLCNGLEIDHIKLVNTFTTPTYGTTEASNYAWFTTSYSAFTDGVSRDTQYSPQACLVCDPFTNSTPSDGGYPSITSYSGTVNFYRGGGGSGGSTGCTFTNMFYANSVVGYIGSPNGVTLNGELMKFDSIQIINCKTGFAGCQAQEKLNTITRVKCWGGTHTLFNFTGHDGYGSQTPGHWVVDDVNIAGQVNRLISRNGVGYFPIYINNVYGESLLTIGNWDASQGDTLSDSTIDFVNLNVFPSYPTNTHFKSTGVTIKDCNLRYYDGTGEPLWFNGGVFEDCTFTKLPYGCQELRNCVINGTPVVTGDVLNNRGNASRYFAAGTGKIIDSGSYAQGKQISLKAQNSNVGGLLVLDGIANSSSSYVVSGSPSTGYSITVTPPTAGDLARAVVGNLCVSLTTGSILGMISSVGVSTYDIAYPPDGLTSGSDVLTVWCPIMYFSFMGDITSGSPTINNVVLDFGVPSDLMNPYYGCGFLKISGFYQFRAYSQGALMLNYNAGAKTITMDRNASENGTGIYFSSNGAVKEISLLSDNSGSGSGVAAAEIFPKGARYFDDIATNGGSREFIVTATGYFSNSPVATMNELTATIGSPTLADGTSTQSGDGATAQFSIAHGLGVSPSFVSVTAGSSDALAGPFYLTKDSTNIYINYQIGSPSGTNNLVFYWAAKV